MPTVRRSQSEYDRRMHAVIEYIDRHLDDKLDLVTLASVAHFSPFHFHRLFHALVGEPLGDYIRRRRLELAAVRLRSQPDATVMQIALGVGFGSAESFSRAFRARFGAAPTQWRNSKRGQVLRKHGKSKGKRGQAAAAALRDHGGPRKKDTAMNVTLIDREPVHVAYLRHMGPYGPSINRFWMETVAPWMVTNNLFGRDRFGIGLDDPIVTQPAKCRYDACVVSKPGEVLTGNPHFKEIPGGRYAALAYEGTGAQIVSAWNALLREWLPRSGLQLDSRPFFEHYPVDGIYDAKTGRFSCNICVPVAPL